MKLSNFLLSIVAALGAAVSASLRVVAAKPTAVISVPSDNGRAGGGFSVEIPKNLTQRQVQLLALAYEIAKYDGHKHPQLLQGIILQESNAGEHSKYKVAGQEFGLKTNERYYGVAQIKLSAAKDVLRHYPEMKTEFKLQTDTDEEIIANLILNDKYNLKTASKYLMILKKHYRIPESQLASAYNQGPGGVNNEKAHRYSTNVARRIASLGT